MFFHYVYMSCTACNRLDWLVDWSISVVRSQQGEADLAQVKGPDCEARNTIKLRTEKADFFHASSSTHSSYLFLTSFARTHHLCRSGEEGRFNDIGRRGGAEESPWPWRERIWGWITETVLDCDSARWVVEEWVRGGRRERRRHWGLGLRVGWAGQEGWNPAF